MRVPLPMRLAAEALGVIAIVVLGAGAGVVSAYRGDVLALEGIAAANGIVIMVLIYSLAHVSGADDDHVGVGLRVGRTPCRLPVLVTRPRSAGKRKDRILHGPVPAYG